MKKFITGLLILIVGISGVFATDPTNSFKVYTEVAGKNLIKVVASNSTFTAPATYQAFTSLVVDESSVKVTTIGSSVGVKELAYFSNQKFTVTMTIAPMTGTNGNPYKIHYSATCGGTAYTSPSGEQSATVEVIKTTDANVVTVGAITVSVTVDQVSYDNAPTDTYTGTISFATAAP